MSTTRKVAGWSARAHNPKVAGSNPAPATNERALPGSREGPSSSRRFDALPSVREANVRQMR